MGSVSTFDQIFGQINRIIVIPILFILIMYDLNF